MPGVLKDGRFWGGVIAGYLICMFVPGLNFKKLTSKGGS